MAVHTMKWSKALGLGLTLAAGVAWGFGSSGCLIPDRCIVVYSYGDNWCMDVVGAQMWPPDAPEYAQDILDEEDLLPSGCRCYNDAEGLILDDVDLANPDYVEFVAEIEEVARYECARLVPEGWDHNCYDVSDQGPALIQPFTRGQGDCIGDCSLTCDSEPDPNPYECEELLANASGGSDDGGDTGGAAETGGDTDTGGPSVLPSFQGEITWPR